MTTTLILIALGILATASPCVLPLYPGYMAYLRAESRPAKSRYVLGFFVLAGVLTLMLLLGLIIGLLSLPVGHLLALAIPLANLLIFTLGVTLIADRNPFKKVPQIGVPLISHPYVDSYLYGLLYGPVALPCAGPLLISLLAIALTAGKLLTQLQVCLWFGMGVGLPLLALSFLSLAGQRWITRQFARHARLVDLLGGLLLVGFASYDFWINWAVLVRYLN